MNATAIILTHANADALAEQAWPEETTVVYTVPGVGAYGSLAELAIVKQPAGLSLEERTAAASQDLARRFPEAVLQLVTEADAPPLAAALPPPPPPAARPVAAGKPARLPTLPAPDPSRYAIIIKSFRRFGCLRRLVRSVRHYYPEARILIADDSFEDAAAADRDPDIAAIRATPGVEWHQLPFDAGLAKGRNLLVRACDAEFVVLCDDDFIFTEETRLENLFAVLDAAPEFAVVCGRVRMDGRRAADWCGTFRFEMTDTDERALVIDPLKLPWERTERGVRYQRTELDHNFFAARRDVLMEHPWDERFYIVHEHLDQFLSFWQAGIGVAHCPDAIVGHWREQSDEYRAWRMRDGRVAVFYQKWGIVGAPNFPTQWCSDVAEYDVQAAHRRARRTGPPNRIVLAIGHSGTSIVASMLGRLGWQLGPADREYSEHVDVRAINEDCLRTGRLDEAAARHALQSLPEPWAIKDPRFVRTLRHWLPLLTEYEPELLWLVRDLDAVRESYRRRGEGIARADEILHRGRTIAEQDRDCAALYRDWPWRKQRIEFERIADAVLEFDVYRALRLNPL